MIWNIHFGYDNFGRNNFEDVAAAIKERKMNVVGLLESDLTRIITGNRDFMEYLEVELNMYRYVCLVCSCACACMCIGMLIFE